MASTAVVLSTGARIRTDEVTSAGGTSNHVQLVRLAAPTIGSTALVASGTPLYTALASNGLGGSSANPLTAGVAPIVDHVYQSTTPLGLNYSSINVTASGIVQIVASATGRILVLAAHFSALSSCSVQWMEGASAAASGLTGAQAMGANAQYVLPFSPVGWFRTSTGNRLNLSVQGTSGGVGGSLVWVRPTV